MPIFTIMIYFKYFFSSFNILKFYWHKFAQSQSNQDAAVLKITKY